ncbi:MAG: hypothetical protein IJZ34_17980 [Lachnospiraceae bacterium]|nr:hypothetical protein [Lachnospiraceae bacterium]
MSITKKKLEDMDIMDDFLMNAVASNKKVGEAFCRRLLSVLLQKKIGRIKIVAQRSLFPDEPGKRGIRMDVEVEEIIEEKEEEAGEDEQENLSVERVLNVYDIEPHLKNDCHLPKRNRFYQAKIDGRHLESGEKDFSRLPNLYMISITDYDPFGKNHMMYTFRNQCKELPELDYEDGLQFVYFYTKGELGGCKDIKNVLKYMRNSNKDNISDDVTREIHDYVSQVKVSPEAKVEYMKFEEIIYYERLDAKVESILELLEEYGTVPDDIRERLEKERSASVLKKWHKLAAKVDSLEEFVEKMNPDM